MMTPCDVILLPYDKRKSPEISFIHRYLFWNSVTWNFVQNTPSLIHWKNGIHVMDQEVVRLINLNWIHHKTNFVKYTYVTMCVTKMQLHVSIITSSMRIKTPGFIHIQDSKIHGANMGPTWVLSPQMGPMLAPWTLLLGILIRDSVESMLFTPQPLRALGYCRRPSGRAGGRAGGRQGRQAPLTLSRPQCSRIIFKLGKDIYCPKVSDKFDHGGSASLNMHIIDHLMSRPLLTFLNSFFKLKSPNLVHK